MNENDKEKKPNRQFMVRAIGYAAALLIMSGAVLYFINEQIFDKKWDSRHLLFSAIIFILMAAYAIAERKRLFPNIRCLIYLLFCFLLSAMLLLLPEVYVNVPIWLFGGIAAAALLNRNMGMLYVYFFVLQAIYLQSGSIRGLVLHFIVATVLCIIIPHMKKWLSMLYVMVVSGALIICLGMIMNEMKLETDLLLNVVWILGIYLACIFTVMLLRCMLLPGLVQTREDMQEEQESENLQNGYDYLSLVASQTMDTVEDSSEHKLTLPKEETKEPEQEMDFSFYCNENAALLQQLKKEKRSSFLHSMLVGKLSSEAAERIGANQSLTNAIGLYHEIGKIREGNASEQTIQIAKEQEFPEHLTQALIECSSKSNVETKSRESAIVILTDTILATYFYLRNNKNYTTTSEKIVDNAIGMNITRGKLNCSGLSVADCAGLRDYFVEQLKTQDERRGIL